ncbi:uncharacterized protein LOC127737061 [Mytilus californianus]|uniref:uncharacterized protein LOC127737061 n=1 Tax=Mytilus californianus TaxID=6549 RepID=UPI002247D8A2|nr:uncharacterized protein LOC127737061 [Mytilus californianus]
MIAFETTGNHQPKRIIRKQMSRFLLVLTVWSVNVAAQKYPKYLGSNGGAPRYEPYQPNQQIALPSNGGSQTSVGGPNGMATSGRIASEVLPTRSGNGNQVNIPLEGGNANNNVENVWQQQNSGMGAGSPNAGSNYPWEVIRPAVVGGGSFNTGGMQRQSAQPGRKSAGNGSGLGGISVDPDIPYEQIPYNNGVLYDIYRQYTGPVDHYVNVAPNIYDPSAMSTALNAPNYLPPSTAMKPVSIQRSGSPSEQFATDIGQGQGIDIAVGNGKTMIQGRGAYPIGNGRTIDRIQLGGHVYEQPMVDSVQSIINGREHPGSNGQMLDIITGNDGSRNVEAFNLGNIDAITRSHFPGKGVQNVVLVIPINFDQLLEQSPGTGSVLAQSFDPNLIGCPGPNCGTSPGLNLPLSAGSAINQDSGSFIEVVDQLTDPRVTDPVENSGFSPGWAPEIITDPLYPPPTNQIMESQPSYVYKPKSKFSKPTYNKRPYSKLKQTYGSYRQTYERPRSYSKPMYRSKHNMYEKPKVKYGKHKLFYSNGYKKPKKYTNTVNYGKPTYQKRKLYSKPRKYQAKSSYIKRRSYKKNYKKGGY